MNLKTSLFNKSIFKSDIKRFWWLGVLETLILITICIVPVYNNCSQPDRYYYYGCEPTWMRGAIAVIFAFSIGISILLFSYLHKNSAVSGHHCLPIKRSTLFFTKIISGAALIIIPMIICAIIFDCFLINPQFREFYTIWDSLKWLISGFMYTAVLFSLTTMTNKMTGNPISTLIFTMGFIVLPLIMWSFFDGFFANHLYGYVNYQGNIIKYLYPDEKLLMTFAGFATYAVLTLIFSAAAYFLYRIRKLETYGEVIAFNWLKPVFIGIIAMLASMVSYQYFANVLNTYGVWYIIPLGLLGTVIAWMISKKSLSPKGILKPISVYIAFALCFCVTIEFDLTGFESRMPNIEDIQSAAITYKNDRHVYNNGEYEITSYLPGQILPDFTEAEDIKKVLSLHSFCINNRASHSDSLIPIEYKLKNGKTFVRRYNVSYTDHANQLRPLYETKEMKAAFYPLADGGDREFISIVIQDRRITQPISIWPDSPYMNKLIDAILEDIKNLSYEEMILPNNSSTNIHVNYKNNYVYNMELPPDFKKYNSSNKSCTISVRPCYNNTIAVLTEIGLYNQIPTADNIEGATVSVWKEGSPNSPVSFKELDIDLQAAKEKGVSITDKEGIKLLYSLYDSMIETTKFSDYNNRFNILIAYRVRDTGHTFEVSCSYDAKNIPHELIKYFENK